MPITNERGVAIIGCGAIFPLHAQAVSEIEGARLLEVVDLDAAKAEHWADEYGCSWSSDYRTLLNRTDIHLVHLCTPHYLHADMAADFLQAGKHVLTEKPIASEMGAAERMIDAAQQSACQLGVVFQNRYNDPSQHIKQIIASGELGQLICMKGIVTWHRDEAYYRQSSWRGRWDTEGGGVLINQTIHTLDLLQWFGGEIASVQGSVSNDSLADVIEVEDSAHAAIFFNNGVRGLFYATNAYLANSPVELELVFEHGTLTQRRDCLYLWKDGREIMLCEPIEGTGKGKSYWGTSHSRLIQDFYAHIMDGRKFWIDGSEGLKALKLVKEIYHSSRQRDRK
ncbi:Gfo/Idh/MocA family protein [Paenibacillus sp. sgz500958]|uniref:Gfo/Idh/MocA family protein n=1 Tax=Paenibacillus sp. sgz500958 TaxID=3242475 RepID=UPI0036D22808